MGNNTCGGGGGGGGGVGGDDLPVDFLIQNILVRLPVVSLLRFKSVSKSWCALIQTSFFINLHTTTTSKQLLLGGGGGGGGSSFILQAESKFLVFSCESGYGTSYEYRYRFGSGGGWFLGTDGNWFHGTSDNKKKNSDYYDADNDSEMVFKLDNLESPHIRYEYNNNSNSSNVIRPTDIVGSCNGLICLFDSKHRDVFLWNPATRQSRILPKSSLTIEKNDYDSYYYYYDDRHLDDTMVVFCAFGFDVKTNDYKVLLINYCTRQTTSMQQPEYLCGVQVYSLRTDSWRVLEGVKSLPGLPMIEHHGLYLNGSCFFVGTKNITSELPSRNNSLIISFDFTKEIFTTMQFPNSDHGDVAKRRRWYLSCMGDKLALFAVRGYKDAVQDYNDDYVNYGYEDQEDQEDYNDYENEDCDIWVLNEHGGGGGGGFGGVIKESWTKLHFFQIQRRGAREWIIPRGILNNGEFALLETRSTVSRGRDAGKKKMQLYNLVTKEAKTDFLVCSRVKTVQVYKPSLVSIIGENGAAAAAATGVIGGAI